LVLLHSRFRPPDRRRHLEAALKEIPPGSGGTIIVSTQVIETGVDISATTLFTELAPWASLVQRFGRCNRGGDENGQAVVRWIALPGGDDAAKLAWPYRLDDLHESARILKGVTDVGPRSLPDVALRFEHRHVIRRKDLVELFDTTPDLAGNDIDIDRFVREVEDTDVRVFWRYWDGDAPPADEPAPSRDELCPAPVGEFREFLKRMEAKSRVFRRDLLQGEWVRADPTAIYPGQSLLFHWQAGGYTSETGWNPKAAGSVEPPWDRHAGDAVEERWKRYERGLRRSGPDPDDYDDDGLSRTDRWQTIAGHTEQVCVELDKIVSGLPLDPSLAECLRGAARWHDWGKSHEVFQDAVVADGRPQPWMGCRVVAKAPGPRRDQEGRAGEKGFWRHYRRKHFRHELASAIGVLHPDALETADADRALLEYFKRARLVAEDVDPGKWPAARDLIAYLIVAHHGKVRLSIRSFPNETKPTDEDGRPQPQRRFARGIWDGDVLPQTDLGGGVTAPEVRLFLEPIELGLCELPPFAGQPSWLERMIRLRDTLGPFHLAFLEALLRAADVRASATEAAAADGTRAHARAQGRGPGNA